MNNITGQIAGLNRIFDFLEEVEILDRKDLEKYTDDEIKQYGLDKFKILSEEDKRSYTTKKQDLTSFFEIGEIKR